MFVMRRYKVKKGRGYMCIESAKIFIFSAGVLFIPVVESKMCTILQIAWQFLFVVHACT